MVARAKRDEHQARGDESCLVAKFEPNENREKRLKYNIFLKS